MLEKLTNWLLAQFLALWEAFKDLMGDLGLGFIKMVLELFASAVELIPVPDVLHDYSVGQLLGQAGTTVLWAVDVLKVGECMLIFAGCYAFRLLRKLITLGQW